MKTRVQLWGRRINNLANHESLLRNLMLYDQTEYPVVRSADLASARLVNTDVFYNAILDALKIAGVEDDDWFPVGNDIFFTTEEQAILFKLSFSI